MTTSQLFVKYHGKQIIVAFVVVVATITWQVINEERMIAHKNAGTVMGETTVNQMIEKQTQNNQMIVAYQGSLKNEVTEYLTKRASVENNNQEWINIINTTKNNILALIVPNEYKDLQIKVVTTLDMEQTAIQENNSRGKKTTEDRWAEILKQYFWLNQ